MSVLHERLVIIGSGPAGYTAAIYAARAMLKPLVIAGMQPGGQLTITTDVENYPGFAAGVMGPELMEAMRAQAEHCGARLEHDLVAKVDFSARPFRLWCDSGRQVTADAVIIATGAQAKWLGLPTEQKFQGYGVSACATCDGFFYRNKPILVVGGGNTAVEEALFLTNFASKVTVIHRRDAFKAERIMQDRLFAHPKIEVRWDTTLDEVLGSETPPKVTGARLMNVKTGTVEEIAVDGIFIAIGHAPSVEVFKGSGLRFKDNGYLWVEPGTPKTNIDGVFACGDVTDDIYRQAVTAAGMGCMAALDAERFLSHSHS